MTDHRLKQLRQAAGLSQDKLAELAGTQQAQIGRLERGQASMTLDYVRRLCTALDCKPADLLPPDMIAETPQTYAHNDLPPLQITPKADKRTDNTPDFIDILLGDDANLTAWRLPSDDLAGKGYMKGDTLIVDANRKPKSGDIVCVQRYNMGTAQTLFRIYHPPFLLGAPINGATSTPIFLDPNGTRITGTVIKSYRET